MSGAKDCAKAFVDTSETLDKYVWRDEVVELQNLVGMEYTSCDLEEDYTYSFSKEEFGPWFEDENIHIGKWKGLLTNWSPDPEGEDMVISFQENTKGETFLAIWEGHHRFAAALLRGIDKIKVVVGRKVIS